MDYTLLYNIRSLSTWEMNLRLL